MANYNWVDYSILAIFFFSILTGFARGFVKEIISLTTLIAAFIVASTFSSALASTFSNTATMQSAVTQASSAIGTSAAQPFSYVMLAISFSLLFAGTMIVGSIVSYLMNFAFQTGILGLGNRLLGGVFGFCRGFIFNLVLIFLIQLTALSAEPWWQQSRLVASFQPAVVWLAGIVSPSLANLKARFGQTFQDVNSSFQGGVQGISNSVQQYIR